MTLVPLSMERTDTIGDEKTMKKVSFIVKVNREGEESK